MMANEPMLKPQRSLWNKMSRRIDLTKFKCERVAQNEEEGNYRVPSPDNENTSSKLATYLRVIIVDLVTWIKLSGLPTDTAKT